MARFEMCFPIQVSKAIAPFLYVLSCMFMRLDGVRRETTYIHLLRRPCVQIYRLDFADVGTHSTVNTRAANTQKDTTSANMKCKKKE
jgi:hypothetical protein